MGDDSRGSLVRSLKNEWSLLWESLSGEDSPEGKESFEGAQIRILSLDDVRRITRELSQDRRKLHRRMESLNKEIELNTAKLESLRIVGQEDDSAVRKLNELAEQGQKISHELEKLDQTLKLARSHEDKIKRDLTPA